MDNNTNNEIPVNDDFYNFIEKYKDSDPNTLRLKKFKEYPFDIKFAILQIECRKKASQKIPELNETKRFLYPSLLSAEQCTSEIIAKFHSSLFNDCNSVLDLTAGLCVDSYYISQKAAHVTAIEINPQIADIGILNMKQLNANVDVINCKSEDYIINNTNKYDAVFADPARRGNNNSRVFAISDCSPNIIPLLHSLKNKAKYLIIKASPMIDITNTLSEINDISDIWVLGIKNECKELLFKVNLMPEPYFAHSPKIHTINFDTVRNQKFSFDYNPDKTSMPPTAFPHIENYLYEPNCCIMKAGAFREIANEYNDLSKLHNNTHLFVSHYKIEGFPGRMFIIEDIIPYKDKELKKIAYKYPHINVSVRNMPITAEQLKTKLKVKDGGEKYLFGVTLCNGSKALLICKKV